MGQSLGLSARYQAEVQQEISLQSLEMSGAGHHLPVRHAVRISGESNAVFLLNASQKYVEAAEREHAKQAVDQVMREWGGDAALVSYAASARTELSFAKRPENQGKWIEKAELRLGCQTKKAICFALALLQERPGSRFIFLCTNGQPDDMDLQFSRDILQLVAHSDVKVVILLHGNVHKRVACIQSSLSMPIEEAMGKVSDLLPPRPAQDPPFHVAFYSSAVVCTEQVIDEGWLLQLRVYNNTDYMVDCSDGLVVRVLPSLFFVNIEYCIYDDIPAAGHMHTVLELKVHQKPRPRVQDFPAALELELEWNGQVWRAAAVIRPAVLRGDYAGEKRLNVMAYGKQAVGKSATLNTLATNVWLNGVLRLFHTSQNPTLGTVRMTRRLVEEGVCLQFIDMWAYDRHVPYASSFDVGSACYRAVEGYFSDGAPINAQVEESATEMSHVHCLIIVVSLKQMQFEKERTMAEYWQNKQLRGPIVVVSGIEDVEHEEQRALDLERIQEAMPAGCQVFWLNNYGRLSNRDAFVDRRAREILLTAHEQAAANLEILKRRFNPVWAAFEGLPQPIVDKLEHAGISPRQVLGSSGNTALSGVGLNDAQVKLVKTRLAEMRWQ